MTSFDKGSFVDDFKLLLSLLFPASRMRKHDDQGKKHISETEIEHKSASKLRKIKVFELQMQKAFLVDEEIKRQRLIESK